MGSRNHDLRNKLQIAMMKLPKDYTSGDLMRCFADAAVEYMDEVAPEPKPYEVKTKGVIGQEYIVFYNDHGAVYGVPREVVYNSYIKCPSIAFMPEVNEERLESYMRDWMTKTELLPHVIMLQPTQSLDELFKDFERVENVATITIDEDSYSS